MKKQINITRWTLTRRLIVSAVCLQFSYYAVGQGQPAALDTADDRPNIVIIMTDDAGYADMGFSRVTKPKIAFQTPNIDAFANSGFAFSQAYTTASVCSPSRAGMLTGRYQQRFGHEFNLPTTPEPGDSEEFNGLNVNEKTIADHLRSAGYRTGLIGKWHLGLAEQFHPNNRGFDEFYGILGGGRSYWDKPDETDSLYTQVFRNHQAEEFEGYFTDKIGQEANQFIESNQQDPFFLFISYTAVHAPMHSRNNAQFKHMPEQEKNRHILQDMTQALDDSVGSVMEKLSTLGLKDNTLVFFLNDNGGPTDANFSDNRPYSGIKGTLYEGGIRVPFALSWPNKIANNKRYEHMVSSLDILPTALAAAKVEGVGELNLDGKNLLPYLAQKTTEKPHSTLFWRRSAFAAVRDEQYKLVRFPDRPAVLYDVDSDPSESINLAEKHPAKVRALLIKLFAWETELQAPLFLTHSKWIEQNRQRYSKYTLVDQQ
jgi:arylsulfatase A-like enzyme